MTPPRAAAAIVLLLCTTASLASTRGTVRVSPGSSAGWVRVQSVDAPLSRVVSAIAMRTGSPLLLAVPDRLVTFDFTARTPGEAAARIARQEGLLAEPSGEGWELRDPAEPTVTIDVVDAEVREILAIVKKQCGIRNVMIDPGVTGKGTFLFHGVPCNTAIRTIFATMGLAAETHPSSVMRVKR